MLRLTIQVVFLCLGLLMTGCIDYSKPGKRGNPPAFEEGLLNQGMEAIFTFSGDEIPDIPECGKTYALVIRTSDPDAICNDYDYSFLYREAIRYLDIRKSEWQCRNECPQLQVYISRQKGVCNGTVATVLMHIIVKCSTASDPFVYGLPVRTNAELLDPFEEMLPPVEFQDNEDYLVQVIDNENSRNCPFTFEMRVMVLENVACQDVADYRPYIERAIEKANLVSTFVECGPNCRKRPLREEGVTWKCENNTVVVEYFFKVPCVRIRRVS